MIGSLLALVPMMILQKLNSDGLLPRSLFTDRLLLRFAFISLDYPRLRTVYRLMRVEVASCVTRRKYLDHRFSSDFRVNELPVIFDC